MSTDFDVGAAALKKWGLIGAAALWLFSFVILMITPGGHMWVLPFFIIVIAGGFAFIFFTVNAMFNISSAFRYMSMKKSDPSHYSVRGANSETLEWVKRIEELGAKLKEKGNA